MRSSFVVLAGCVAFLLAPGGARAQTGAGSPWEVGAGVGVSVNEPEAPYDGCDPGGVRPAGSLSVAYRPFPWLAVQARGTLHQDVSGDRCPVPLASRPRTVAPIGPGVHTFRDYPERIRGPSYLTNTARLVVTPVPDRETVRPYIVVGGGRIWSKELSYPEVGAGAAVPVGPVTARLEVVGQRLVVPADSVRIRVSEALEVVNATRIPIEEVHLPVRFRVGVGWKP